MSLNTITLEDRKNLVRLLELPAYELEETGTLYRSLIELEERENRLNAGLITSLRGYITELDTLTTEVDNLASAGTDQDIRVIDVDGEYEMEYFKGGGVLAGKKQRQLELRMHLQRILNLHNRQDFTFTNRYQNGNSLTFR